jgi:hypothetical protein
MGGKPRIQPYRNYENALVCDNRYSGISNMIQALFA